MENETALYNLTADQRFKFLNNEDVFTFKNIDGMYCNVIAPDDRKVLVAVFTKVIIVD